MGTKIVWNNSRNRCSTVVLPEFSHNCCMRTRSMWPPMARTQKEVRHQLLFASCFLNDGKKKELQLPAWYTLSRTRSGTLSILRRKFLLQANLQSSQLCLQRKLKHSAKATSWLDRLRRCKSFVQKGLVGIMTINTFSTQNSRNAATAGENCKINSDTFGSRNFSFLGRKSRSLGVDTKHSFQKMNMKNSKWNDFNLFTQIGKTTLKSYDC